MRIAHLTDPHLRHHTPGHPDLPVRRSREALDLITAALADARRRDVDAVVITGDIVDVPQYLFEPERHVAGDDLLWRQVREDYRLVRRTLDASGLPWIALPGNHDSYRLLAEELDSGPYVRDIAGVRFVSFPDRESTGNIPRRTLTQRQRFESAMIDPGPRPQVHLQHFVITPELNDHYPHTYEEGEFLRRRIVDSDRVALVLSGHFHPGVEPIQQGRTTFSVTPALAEYPHPYRIFDITVEGRQWSVTHEQVDLAAPAPPRKVVFLDRDGCITIHPTYHEGPESLQLLPGAAPALRLLREHGYASVVVTNQACVGLGYVDLSTLSAVHDRMSALLADEGSGVDAVYASLGAGERSVSDRYNAGDLPKPSPQLVQRAARELRLDLAGSYLIGDRATDLGAAKAAGIEPILVRTGDGRRTEQDAVTDCLVVDHLADAVAKIIEIDQRPAEPTSRG